MPVLDEDMKMYEMSPSWSRSLLPFYSLSFIYSLTHTGFSTKVDIDRSQCKGHKSRKRNVFFSYYFRC